MWSLTHPSESTLTSAYRKLAQLNPFRYRSYVWDEETGLYYLRSRYYDPAWGRFTGTDTKITGNLYRYCEGNPINLLDNSGKSSISYMVMQPALHNRVVAKVARKVNGHVERTLTRTDGAGPHGGIGYPDVISIEKNCVWEIKPDTRYGRISGAAQMKRYVEGGREAGDSVEIKPFPYTLNGKNGMVHVRNGQAPIDKGVVYYHFMPYQEEEEAEYATVPAEAPNSDNVMEASGWNGGGILAGLIIIAALCTPWPDEIVVASALSLV